MSFVEDYLLYYYLRVNLLKTKTLYILIGSLVIILLFSLPLITNWLMHLKTPIQVAGDTNTWIGFQATYWGAIIGGLISGALTLIGVRYTIIRQQHIELIKAYPEKRKLGDDIKSTVIEAWRVTNDLLNKEEYHLLHQYTEKILNDYDTLLSKASKVNDEIYELVRHDFFVIIRYLYIDLNLKENNHLYSIESKFYISHLEKCQHQTIGKVDKITEEYRKIKK